jgi:hypothetical protein
MAKGLEKRKRIFAKYVEQLKLLNEGSMLSEPFRFDSEKYVCPICLNQFSEEHLSDNSNQMLTLEDAPPKSLGGKANTLTCKSCNNKSGHEIDFHLTEHLIEKDIRDFLPNIKSKASFLHKGKKVQGELNVDSNGNITVIHSNKNNNPTNLDEYVNETGKDDIINIEFKKSRVDRLRLEVALLKSAYILAFEKYGYALILNESYDIVREQLRNPNKEIYPEGFWTKQSSFTEEHEGVHLIKSDGFEGFYAIFVLKTNISEHRYGVYLPISKHLTKGIIYKLKEQLGGFALNLESLEVNNYLQDSENMQLLTSYIDKRNTP